MLGSLGLIAAAVALVSGEPAVLATLVVVTVGLCVTATTLHLLVTPAVPPTVHHRPDALETGPRRVVRH